MRKRRAQHLPRIIISASTWRAYIMRHALAAYRAAAQNNNNARGININKTQRRSRRAPSRTAYNNARQHLALSPRAIGAHTRVIASTLSSTLASYHGGYGVRHLEYNLEETISNQSIRK